MVNLVLTGGGGKLIQVVAVEDVEDLVALVSQIVTSIAMVKLSQIVQ